MIRFLDNKEKVITKELYETVFDDTEKFVEYYYADRIEKNRVLVCEQNNKVVAMLHLNPHDIYINGEIYNIDYIYAVATHPSYRRQGYMEQLLEYAFKVMKDEGKPFTYLIPENPLVYKKYGFDFIYSKKENIDYEKAVVSPKILVRKADKYDIEEMVKFCDILVNQYDVFMVKDAAYFETLLPQLEAENGYMELMYFLGELVGIRMINSENEMKIIEEVAMSGYETIPLDMGEKPFIMAKELKPGILDDLKGKSIFINEMV